MRPDEPQDPQRASCGQDTLLRTRVDPCGVCGGASTCVGCDGVPHSNVTEDACGVCGGDNTTCAGCDGEPNSGLVLDACDVCGGDGICRRAFRVTEPMAFAGGASASSIQAVVAAMLSLPTRDVVVEIVALAQQVSQAVQLPGAASDFNGTAARLELEQAVMGMLAQSGADASAAEVRAPPAPCPHWIRRAFSSHTRVCVRTGAGALRA